MTLTSYKHVFVPIILALLFAIAYTQPLSLYSNQHQYFLHAAALNHEGNLSQDWLANSKDPTPFFSHTLAWGMKVTGPFVYQAGMFVLLMVYFLSFRKVIYQLGLLPKTRLGEWLWAALFTASHAAIFRYASDRTFGADYFWFVQCGMANQYLLGPGLQPSVFGVLLVVSLAMALSHRMVLAVVFAIAACVVHATYVLPAAMLITGLCFGFGIRNQAKPFIAATMGLGTVAAIAFFSFAPTSAETFAQSQTILSEIRIPHHTRPQRWFDIMGGFQICWLLFGWWLLRKTTLGVPMAIMLILMAIDTVLVLITNHPTLALAFPWRLSALLIPLVTVAVAAKLATQFERLPRLTTFLAVTLFAISVIGAGVIYSVKLGYREPPSEEAVLEYVKQTAKPGDVYLIPARFPKPNPPAGVYSATFSRPPGENAIVYFELARFRLNTGACIYVDFKSIPYQDTEVLEWHRRVERCVDWFGKKEWTAETLIEIHKEGITHVVAPASKPIVSPGVVPLHTAGVYVVYKVLPPN